MYSGDIQISSDGEWVVYQEWRSSSGLFSSRSDGRVLPRELEGRAVGYFEITPDSARVVYARSSGGLFSAAIDRSSASLPLASWGANAVRD